MRGIDGEVVSNTRNRRPSEHKPSIIAISHGDPDFSQSHAFLELEAVGAAGLADEKQVAEEEQVAVERRGSGAEGAELDGRLHDEGAGGEGTAARADGPAYIQARSLPQAFLFLKENVGGYPWEYVDLYEAASILWL